MPRFEDDEYADYGVRTKNRADGAAKTRRKARKPVKRGSVSEIVWDDRAAVRPTSTTRFADPDMQRLFDRGYFDTLVDATVVAEPLFDPDMEKIRADEHATQTTLAHASHPEGVRS